MLPCSHFCFESDQFHASSEDPIFLLVGIVAQLKSNIVSYLPAANSFAAGFFFKADLWQVKDCAAFVASLHFNISTPIHSNAFVEGLLAHSYNVCHCEGKSSEKEEELHILVVGLL